MLRQNTHRPEQRRTWPTQYSGLGDIMKRTHLIYLLTGLLIMATLASATISIYLSLWRG